MALLSGHSLLVLLLVFTSSVLLRVHQRGHDNCPVPSWRCSLDTRYSSSARLAFHRGGDCSRLSPGVGCPVQVVAALSPLAIHRRSALDVVSVVTFPDCGLVSAVPYHVGVALWALTIHRHRLGLHVVGSVVTFPDGGLVSAVPYSVGVALWALALHRRPAVDVVSVVIALDNVTASSALSLVNNDCVNECFYAALSPAKFRIQNVVQKGAHRD